MKYWIINYLILTEQLLIKIAQNLVVVKDVKHIVPAVKELFIQKYYYICGLVIV